jgi:ubiquinone/menaquinone biosynthesis C-methylase UbiE
MADAAPPSPLSTPAPWDLVADGYVGENVAHFERYAADALELAGFAAAEHARVVDVAAGPGTLALLAARRAARVDAIDFAPAMIAHLQRRAAAEGLTNVTARVGDGQALPYADASADFAFSMFGLMFFPDRARGFAELRRVLVPGGRAVVSSWKPMDDAPLVAALFAAIAAESPSPGMPQPAQKGPLTDPEDFRAELRAAGFRDVEVVGRVHAIEWPDVEDCWHSVSRGFAPLVLMKARLGETVFAPIADRIRARLVEAIGPGPGRSEMPAWLGVGTA